jgi:hypothetical protein
MTHRVVAVYHNPWPQCGLERPPGRSPAALYRFAVWYKANPRSEDYMRALLAERLPEAAWVSIEQDADWPERVAVADQVVLLYPDAIGLGFGAVERTLMARKRPWAGVVALNGRHRKFLLNGATRRALMLRRLLEWTMLPELLFLPMFVVLTPLLWAVDLVRGRT